MAIKTAWVGFLFLVSQTFAASVGQDLEIHLPLEMKKLSNGLTVIMIPDTTTPSVSYQTWVKVGSVDEQPGATGLAHLFEHLMFKGTKKYGPREFFLKLETRGAEVNAYTNRDYTVYHEDFTPNLLDLVIEMEADRLVNLNLTEEVFRTEVQVVLEERQLRVENSPIAKMQEALWGLAYRVHPYQWPVLGYPQDLVRANLDLIQSFYKKYYQPSNVTLVISGNINPSEVYKKVEAAYGAIARAPVPERKIPKEPTSNGERRLVLFDKVATPLFGIAYLITAADDADSYALDVLNNILFEGSRSRAQKLLIEDKNIVATLDGLAFTPQYPGLYLITGTMQGKNRPEEVEKQLDFLFAEVQKNGVTDEEIKIAVRQLTMDIVEGLQTPHGIAQLVGTVFTIFGDPYRFKDDLARYSKITREDVLRVSKKYFDPNNRTIISVLPKSDEKVENTKSRKAGHASSK